MIMLIDYKTIEASENKIAIMNVIEKWANKMLND